MSLNNINVYLRTRDFKVCQNYYLVDHSLSRHNYYFSGWDQDEPSLPSKKKVFVGKSKRPAKLGRL